MGIREYLRRKKEKKFRKKYKVGLCLSGGGARGFAYIGAFKAFDEAGIKFDMVAGTSAGSLFGAIYASDLDVTSLDKEIKDFSNNNFRKSTLGFLPSKMTSLKDTLDKLLPYKKIEDLPIPYFAVSVDLKTGQEIDFHSGDLSTVITGSCAIPGVFYPVNYKNMMLIDGGCANNIPADVLRKNGCDFVVTIDCNSYRGGGVNSNNFFKQFITSIGIMMVNNSRKGLQESDIVIKPKTKDFSSLNVNDKYEIIEAGYQATVEMIPEIKKLFVGKYQKVRKSNNKINKLRNNISLFTNK